MNLLFGAERLGVGFDICLQTKINAFPSIDSGELRDFHIFYTVYAQLNTRELVANHAMSPVRPEYISYRFCHHHYYCLITLYSTK